MSWYSFFTMEVARNHDCPAYHIFSCYNGSEECSIEQPQIKVYYSARD